MGWGNFSFQASGNINNIAPYTYVFSSGVEEPTTVIVVKKITNKDLLSSITVEKIARALTATKKIKKKSRTRNEKNWTKQKQDENQGDAGKTKKSPERTKAKQHRLHNPLKMQRACQICKN